MTDNELRELSERLGLSPGKMVHSHRMLAYIVSVITKERERLAKNLSQFEGLPEGLADAIVDSSQDDEIFKWIRPETDSPES